MKKCSSIMMRKSKFIKNICNSNYCCCIYFHLVNEKDLAPSFSIENEKKNINVIGKDMETQRICK